MRDIAHNQDAPAPPSIVTVVLVSYCESPVESKYLLSCLTALPAAFQDVTMEIIIVDNNSPDTSFFERVSGTGNIRLIRNSHNRGFAAGTNQGISKVTGKYILLLNPDTLPPPGSLKSLVIALEAYPKAFAMSPLLQNSDGTPQFCWARFPTADSELRGREDRSQSPYPLADFQDSARCAVMSPFIADWVGGACLLMRKSAIEMIGALDEDFFFYGEETDWCHRVKQVGAAIMVDPRIMVMHYGGQERLTGVRRRYLFESRIRLYRKMYGLFAGSFAILTAFLRYSLRHLRYRGER